MHRASLSSLAFTTTAVMLTAVTLLVGRAVTLMKQGTAPLLEAAGVARVGARRPAAVLLGSAVIAVALSSPAVDRAVATVPSLAVVLIGAWLLVLGALQFADFGKAPYPRSLEAIAEATAAHWPQRWFARRLRRPVDAWFAGLLVEQSAAIGLAWVVLLAGGRLRVMNVAYFWIVVAQGLYRHELLDHTNIHNRLFTAGPQASRYDRAVLRAVDLYLEYLLNALWLRMPGFYRMQHVYIHHVENNGLADTQSTLPYDRASFIDFCRFAALSAASFSVPVDAVVYFGRRGQPWRALTVVRSVVLWYGFLAAVAWYDLFAASVVCVVRVLFLVVGSSGVYLWHGLADPAEPENVFRNSANLTARDGHAYFGNNAHIEHHLRPGAHWSTMGPSASSNGARHDRERSVTFNAGVPAIANVYLKHLWLGRLDLWPDLMRIAGASAAPSDLHALVHERTRPAPSIRGSRRWPRLDDRLGRLIAAYLVDARTFR